MLEDFYESGLRIQEIRSGPRGWLLERFAEELRQTGYAELTARRRIRAAEHLVYWTNQKGVVTECLKEDCVESFDRHLRRCQCPHCGHNNRGELRESVRQFLKFLRRIGVVTGAITTETTPEPILLQRFHAWMHQQRGTFDSTLYNYGLAIRDLLKALGEDPSSYDAQGFAKVCPGAQSALRMGESEENRHGSPGVHSISGCGGEMFSQSGSSYSHTGALASFISAPVSAT